MSPTYLYSSLVVSILVAQSAAQGEYDPNDIEALNAAGAAGKSGGGGMSTGGMIALCVIVGVVVILGCSFFPTGAHSLMQVVVMLTSSPCYSLFRRSLLHSQEASMGYARGAPTIRQTSGSSRQDASHAPVSQKPTAAYSGW